MIKEAGRPSADRGLLARSGGTNSGSEACVLADHPTAYVGYRRGISNLTRLTKWKGFSNQSQLSVLVRDLGIIGPTNLDSMTTSNKSRNISQAIQARAKSSDGHESPARALSLWRLNDPEAEDIYSTSW